MVAVNPRKLFIHVIVLLAIVGFTIEARRFEFLSPGPACVECSGAGEFRRVEWVEDGQVLRVETCRYCDGSGRKDPWHERFERLLPTLKVGLCGLVLLALVAAVVWAFKVVDCRVCGGAGGLALEVTSPGEGTINVDDACFACEGRGRLTVIDRWVLLTTDRSDPVPNPTLADLRGHVNHRRRPHSR
jgi:hypothetical protein